MNGPSKDSQRLLDRLALGEIELDDRELRAASLEDPGLAHELEELDRIASGLEASSLEAREIVAETRGPQGTAAEERVRSVVLDHLQGGGAAPAATRRSWLKWGVAIAAAAAIALLIWRPDRTQEERPLTALGGKIEFVAPVGDIDATSFDEFRWTYSEPVLKADSWFEVEVRDQRTLAPVASSGRLSSPSWRPDPPIAATEIEWTVTLYSDASSPRSSDWVSARRKRE